MNGNDVHIKLLGNMQAMHAIDLKIHNTCLIADILKRLLFFTSLVYCEKALWFLSDCYDQSLSTALNPGV
jgi:hypothetical protein